MPLTTVQAGMLDTTAQYYSFKNRIINGEMDIDQRNAGASVTPAASTYTLDRWRFGCPSAKMSVQQNAGGVTPPDGFRNYIGVTTTSAYTPAAAEAFTIAQFIEGNNVADLMLGTANAKTFTLSFWVRSSLTGLFGAAFSNDNGGNRSYPFSYTISAANTWEFKTVTVTGDTSGTWGTTNGAGLGLFFSLGVGSNFVGTAGSWVAGDFRTTTGATSVVGTSGATFYITGVQLEKGSTATSFDYRPYGTELALCQRYFIAFTNTLFGGANNRIATGSGASTTIVRFGFPFPVAMRSAPSVTMSGTPRAEAGSAISITSASSAGMNIYGAGIDCSAASGLTAGTAYMMDTGSGGYSFSSEL
jgi:hypothetical protein